MKTTVKEILALAVAQIGTKEEPMGSKNVKYNTWYYGGKVNNSKLHWCVAFINWLFAQMGASSEFYGGRGTAKEGGTASCTTLYTYHSGQRVTDYQPGDIIFFNFSGGKSTVHVGICESWDGENITTIDGNTSSANQANGGTVARRVRDKKYIVGAYRPNYKGEESEMEMTFEKFREYMLRLEQERAALPVSDWAKEDMAQAVKNGITDGKRPQSTGTRQEMAVMLVRALRNAAKEGK